MDISEERYHLRIAAAFVRGKALQTEATLPSSELTTRPLADWSQSEFAELFRQGDAAGLKLHKFKRTMGLPRVRRVLGQLRGLGASNQLDVGSGRGVFLWPLLDTFPYLPITAIDQDERRAHDLEAVRLGGIDTLTAHRTDVTALSFPENSFDVVTMLEVLEHIPDSTAALANVIRVARRFVILSVPSKEDDNPEHIHLFDQERLRTMLTELGITRVNFEYVPGHMIAVVNVSQR